MRQALYAPAGKPGRFCSTAVEAGVPVGEGRGEGLSVAVRGSERGKVRGCERGRVRECEKGDVRECERGAAR